MSPVLCLSSVGEANAYSHCSHGYGPPCSILCTDYYAVLVWAAMSHNHMVHMDMDFHEVSCVTTMYVALAVLKTLTPNHIVRMDMYIHDLFCVSH